MRPSILALLTAFLCVSAGRPAPVPKDEKAEQFKRLQGIWVIESTEDRDTKWTEENVGKVAPLCMVTIEKETLRYEFRVRGINRDYHVWDRVFALDPEKEPAKLWATKRVSSPKEVKATCPFDRCAYEVTGDRLRVVFDRGDGERFPDSFDVKKGVGREVYVFKRLAKDPRKE